MFQNDGARALGVARDGAPDEIIDVAAAAGGSTPLPADILGVIDAGADVLERLRQVASATPAAGAVRSLADLNILPPFDPPRGNVLAIGRNYQKHAEEGARAMNTEVGPPTIFTKAITAITGPYANITIDPSVSVKIDWEVELGVVIGRRGANIKRADALDHVFGYTVLNDVTARDI
ncbi:MAG: fumarylacetoacetate hydrolase family protein, partial [Candidatus Dormiibacterota bacterium]